MGDKSELRIRVVSSVSDKRRYVYKMVTIDGNTPIDNSA